MRIRFWGTRGSLAKPGPSTIRYGGNTSCVEVRAGDGTLIILDCGTGAHDLGRSLVASGESPVSGHLLLTHTHWDHIQGFPFSRRSLFRGTNGTSTRRRAWDSDWRILSPVRWSTSISRSRWGSSAP